MSANDPEHRLDKLGLFLLAGLVVVVLGGVVFGVFYRSTVPDKGDVLLGGIVTGLILFLRDLVNAVRSSWEEVTRGKTMDQLAGSLPGGSDGPSGTKTDPLHVAGADPGTKPVTTRPAEDGDD
ncbi:MAG TPA: hypothetical protein VFQ67_00965 [Allosphingosinicella sp.]|jgi:hypothetical protein|nr:hypothetical protein [Allosphingosinicella sp.]